jgi:hypothetical protein
MKTLKSMAQHTLFVHSGLFNMIGFDRDDMINIGRIHLVSFLGLFSMEMMPDKYREFVEKFMLTKVDPPDEFDVLNKNKANFTLFFKQRMEEVVRVCRQKVRNIKGVPFEEFQPFCGPKKPPTNLEQLLANHSDFQFHKMDMDVFKTIRKKAKAYGKVAFRYEKMWYIIIPVRQKFLGATDFAGADMDPRDNIHNMDPETLLSTLEENKKWDRRKTVFRNKTAEERSEILLNFIQKNENVSMFADEVKIAKRTLARMGLWNSEA